MAIEDSMTVGQRLIASMEEGLEDLRAERQLSVTFIPTPPDQPRQVSE